MFYPQFAHNDVMNTADDILPRKHFIGAEKKERKSSLYTGRFDLLDFKALCI